ncbi:MAG: helix-turn-helix domain-containing protein [Opitutaceae bacterium]|nr:helix-turn-helix domain-containing protein [Opitutaceae bacterium]
MPRAIVSPKSVPDVLRQTIQDKTSDLRASLISGLRHPPSQYARLRCLILLAWADGHPQARICANLHLSKSKVNRLLRESRNYLNTHGGAALNSDSLVGNMLRLPVAKAGRPRVTPEIERQVLAASAHARVKPPGFRELAPQLGIHLGTCYKIVRRARQDHLVSMIAANRK